MATTKEKKKTGYIVSIVGILFIILGALWVTVIFPSLDKMPADYARTYYFDGTFTVLDPETQAPMTFPVAQELVQEAIGTVNGAIKISEVRKVTNAVTGDVLAQYGDSSVLTVDRRSLEYVPALDERGRSGRWGPPRPLGIETTFGLYNPGVRQPLTAAYSYSESFRGLNVYVFVIEEADLPLGKHPQTNADMFYSTTITLWIEPSTGAVVNQTAETTTTMDMQGQRILVQSSTINYADQTVDELMDVATSSRTMLMWFKTVIPWLLIGLGAVMVLIDVLILGRRKTA
ncbi:MAG: DUF3068 domain-containing protein [Dehalococcoidia bacterium]|nr:DUF3068 domain-containing protein [Dehalococcoidia bacterium]